MNKIASVCIVSVLMLGTFACVPSQRGDVVSRSQARSPMVVHQATIIDLREVTIEGTPGLLGGIAGGALGFAVGNTVGGGSGNRSARTGGVIGGALAGAAVENRATQRSALEFTVEKDNGQILAFVQEADDEFMIGDRVRLMQSGDGTWRVRQ